jgi:hypothetical protein
LGKVSVDKGKTAAWGIYPDEVPAGAGVEFCPFLVFLGFDFLPPGYHEYFTGGAVFFYSSFPGALAQVPRGQKGVFLFVTMRK